MNWLDRIIINKCHILLNIQLDFWQKLQKLCKVIEFAIQLVLLIAILLISKESKLLSMISIGELLIFWDQTIWHNIAYSMCICKKKNIDEVIMQRVGQ